MTGLRTFGLAFAAVAMVACSAPGEHRRMESDAELQARDERDYENSPDIQLPQLRRQLFALGIAAGEIREETEDHGVRIFKLSLDNAKFGALDKAALAKLEIDSRYRLQLQDPGQAKALAEFSVAESGNRKKARALHELAANGEIDRFPRYRTGASMNAYARALEHYCGYQPGEALNVIDGRWLEYRNQMVDMAVERQGPQSTARASFDCVVRIVYATDLQPHFIGNRGLRGANIS